MTSWLVGGLGAVEGLIAVIFHFVVFVIIVSGFGIMVKLLFPFSSYSGGIAELYILDYGVIIGFLVVCVMMFYVQNILKVLLSPLSLSLSLSLSLFALN